MKTTNKKQTIISYLQKKGFSAEVATTRVNRNYEYVCRVYPDATVREMAIILTSLN